MEVKGDKKFFDRKSNKCDWVDGDDDIVVILFYFFYYLLSYLGCIYNFYWIKFVFEWF